MASQSGGEGIPGQGSWALRSHSSCSPEVEKDTRENMTILQIYFQQDRDDVLDNLLAFVCAIWPEIRENYRINR
ncbi:hypothetical protein M91_01049 [Bos mutus]|uniref:Uncharacterized protein n=1 Tax=Bos mutus TaxID=72004 RepID=L8ISL4_9CETA|nr:hypothetical protein M91_01049 [Bos mutus]